MSEGHTLKNKAKLKAKLSTRTNDIKIVLWWMGDQSISETCFDLICCNYEESLRNADITTKKMFFNEFVDQKKKKME